MSSIRGWRFLKLGIKNNNNNVTSTFNVSNVINLEKNIISIVSYNDKICKK
jgi:hypothetical protein